MHRFQTSGCRSSSSDNISTTTTTTTTTTTATYEETTVDDDHHDDDEKAAKRTTISQQHNRHYDETETRSGAATGNDYELAPRSVNGGGAIGERGGAFGERGRKGRTRRHDSGNDVYCTVQRGDYDVDGEERVRLALKDADAGTIRLARSVEEFDEDGDEIGGCAGDDIHSKGNEGYSVFW